MMWRCKFADRILYVFHEFAINKTKISTMLILFHNIKEDSVSNQTSAKAWHVTQQEHDVYLTSH